MTTRTASCSCGQLRSTATGEPVRVSACHCLACKKRTGSAFSVQARWPADQVEIKGCSQVFTRIAESGNPADFHFCPECGATVHFMTANLPGWIAIPLGIFDDPFFATPKISIFEEHKHPWVEIAGDDVEHFDQKILSYAGPDVLDAIMRLTAGNWVEVQGVIRLGHTSACQLTAFSLPGDVAIFAIARELCDFR